MLLAGYENGEVEPIEECGAVYELASALRAWLLQLPSPLLSADDLGGAAGGGAAPAPELKVKNHRADPKFAS